MGLRFGPYIGANEYGQSKRGENISLDCRRVGVSTSASPATDILTVLKEMVPSFLGTLWAVSNFGIAGPLPSCKRSRAIAQTFFAWHLVLFVNVSLHCWIFTERIRNQDGCTVYTSSVDQKVCQYSLIRLQKTESERTFTTKQWAQTSSRRLHSHDVRALALWPPYANLPASHCRTFSLNVAPIIASGGLDMSVVLTPAASPASSLTKTLNPLRTSVEASFADAYHRRLAYTNGRTTSIAKGASLVASMGDAHVSIWRVKRLEPEHSRDSDDFIQQQDKGGWQKVLEMDLHVQSNLTTCELSHNGQWLLLSDWYETKLFALDAHVSSCQPCILQI